MKVFVILSAVALSAALAVSAAMGASLPGLGKIGGAESAVEQDAGDGGEELRGTNGQQGENGSAPDAVVDDGDRPVSNIDPYVPGREEPSVGAPGQVDYGDRQVVEAPIDEVEIVVMESFPPQYAVRIVSGLPSGCAEFHDLTVEREGNVITITVTNTMPASDEVICTMIYGLKEHNVNLGSDFVSGEEYTVVVNDVTKTFVAQ